MQFELNLERKNASHLEEKRDLSFSSVLIVKVSKHLEMSESP